MAWKAEWKIMAVLTVGFLAAFFLPVGTARFDGAVLEGLRMVKGYARDHVVVSLLPAFIIAGAIGVFFSQGAVMRLLGPEAPRAVAYGVASVSGAVLAVCSCTVLPLFAGIYKRGAGLGPAVAFLYAGPAINVLAVILTAKVLGAEMGIARAVGAVVFALLIGAVMHGLFRGEEDARAKPPGPQILDAPERPIGRSAVVFAILLGILVAANGAPAESGPLAVLFSLKWPITAGLAVFLAVALVGWFGWPRARTALAAAAVTATALAFPDRPQIAFAVGLAGFAVVAATGHEEAAEWAAQTWSFTKQILPLLLVGVLAAGLLFGRPGHEGLIPSGWVAWAVGGNGVGATLLASVVGAFTYFATLTEVPLVEGLIGAGMGKGPALALLLAGPAVSLPNMLVIRSVLGTRKTVVYIALVVVMATVSGLIYGNLWS